MERVWQQYYANHQEAIRDVSHYITVFYNPVRLHSTLNYQTPNQFEQNIDNLPSELSGFTGPLQFDYRSYTEDIAGIL